MRKQEDVERKQTLLEELCEDDEPLYTVLSSYLYHTPLGAISKKDLDALIKEAEESGNFRPAIDKAIFEGSQNPEERQRYVEVIRNLALRAIDAVGQARQQREKEGLTDRAASLAARIEAYRFMSERTGDILTVASEYYRERLLDAEESDRRQSRQDEKRQSDSEERAIREREEGERVARRTERKKMGRIGRREAKRREKVESAATELRRRGREEKRSEAEEEERQIGEMEKTAREARKEERKRS